MAYYSVTGAPVQDSRGTSPAIRAEFALIAAGFAALPVQAAIWGGSANYGVDSGSANAYVVSIAPTYITGYTDGLRILVKALNANTGPSTINLNGLGIKSIVRPNGTVLVANDILAGQTVTLTYDLSNSRFQLAASASGGAPVNYSGTAAATIDLLTGASIASAATVNLDTATGNRVHITGTTTITAVTLTRGPRTVIFDGALTLTHHATNNNLPSAANITTAAGDRAIYESDGTSVYCVSYIRASGAGVVSSGAMTLLATLTPTAVANLDALNVFTSGYDNYHIVGEGLKPASNDTFGVRFANSGVVDSASNYITNYPGATTTSSATSTSVLISISGSPVLATGLGLNFYINVLNANSTSLKAVLGQFAYQDGAFPTFMLCGIHTAYQAASAISGVRFLWPGSSNNFAATGVIRIYGYANT